MKSQPNILFLVHRVPYPPNRGDRIRSYHVLKQLANCGKVYLATLADEPLEPGTTETLALYCQSVAIEPLTGQRWLRAIGSLASGQSATTGLFYSLRLRKAIQGWCAQLSFDAVVVFCSSMTSYLDIEGLNTIPVIADLVDVDSQKFLDYARSSRGLQAWLYRFEGKRLQRVERKLCQRAQAVTLVSEAEANIFRSACPNDKTSVVKNGVDLEYFRPAVQSPKLRHCVFVGALDYWPNIDGIGWFCREIWPQIRRQHPTATLAIVGRQPVPAVRQLAAIEGVQVLGSVPDVRPHVAEAAIAIVPLRLARGIQNKVLEAMAMEKPVIASLAALEGLDITVGEQALAAESTAEWITSIDSLFRNPQRGIELGIAGRRFVETEHHWETCLSPLNDLLGFKGSDLTASSPRELENVP